MSSEGALPLEVTPSDARALVLESNALIVDVREKWEWDVCRIADAHHIPLRDLPQRRDEVPADRPVIFNCHHGMRSMQAVSWFRQQGYDNVTNLHGGIDLWSQEIDSSVARY